MPSTSGTLHVTCPATATCPHGSHRLKKQCLQLVVACPLGHADEVVDGGLPAWEGQGQVHALHGGRLRLRPLSLSLSLRLSHQVSQSRHTALSKPRPLHSMSHGHM